MGKVYIVDGKRYTFEEVSYIPGRKQVFKINGQKVELAVDAEGGRDCFMELKMPETARDKANEMLPAVYEIMEQRIKKGEARKLEQAAMLQLHYNEALRAEDMARGLTGGNTVVQSVVNKEDLSVRKEQVKLDMDLTKRFPWLNNKESREHKSLQQIIRYRKLEYYPDGSMYDNLALDLRMQRIGFEIGKDGRQVSGSRENSKNHYPPARLFQMLKEDRA